MGITYLTKALKLLGKLTPATKEIPYFASSTTSGTIAFYDGTLVWDPGSLADGAGETSSGITVTGAALGDYVMVAAPYDLQDMTVTAYVSAADTVEIRIQNESGGVVDLGSGTWKVRVMSS